MQCVQLIYSIFTDEFKSFCLEDKFGSFYDRGIKSIKGQHMKDFKRLESCLPS